MVKFEIYDCVIYPCIGGLLIAIASSLNLYLKARITGFSGIVYNLWSKEDPNNIWRWSLIYGLIISTCLLRVIFGSTFFETQDKFLNNLSIGGFILGGFLVGVGTKLGNGCTSGHGVCGLPRLSKRSFAAVGCFMTTGIGIATIKHHYNFLNSDNVILPLHKYFYTSNIFTRDYLIYSIILGVTLVYVIYFIMIYKNRTATIDNYDLSDLISGLVVGFIFGCGLSISGMIKREKVINFLSISSNWDPSLMFVLGVSVTINFITFKIILNKTELPPFASKPCTFNNSLDANVFIGPAIFGLGWGLSGLCPGPVICNFFLYLPQLTIFVIFIILGQVVGKYASTYTMNLCKTKTEEKEQLNNPK